MIDSETMLRLMVGLTGAVYLFLSYVSIKDVTFPRAVVPTIVAVAAVVGIWVFAPGFLEVGAIGLPFRVRQLGLAAGGLAIIVRYVGLRRPIQGRAGVYLAALGVPLLGVGFILATANWVVAVAAAVLAGTDLVRRVGASRRSPTEHSPGPPDTQ